MAISFKYQYYMLEYEEFDCKLLEDAGFFLQDSIWYFNKTDSLPPYVRMENCTAMDTTISINHISIDEFNKAQLMMDFSWCLAYDVFNRDQHRASRVEVHDSALEISLFDLRPDYFYVRSYSKVTLGSKSRSQVEGWMAMAELIRKLEHRTL